ncbi:MAG TPA: low temperature requirement protein A [Micromonospora sp.]|nr:low temperature requirement protein A [Micromonospora sp.]
MLRLPEGAGRRQNGLIMHAGIEAQSGESGERPRTATFLELFFDLAFVFALTRVAARMYGRLTMHPDLWQVTVGAGKATLLLVALFAIWHQTAWLTSRYDPDSAAVQLVVIIALVATMVMGIALLRAFSSGALAFAIAFATAQISQPLVLIALRRHERHRLELRMLIIYSIAAVPWVVGALLPGWPRALLWVLALAAVYTAPRFGWPVPGLGRSTRETRSEIAVEHLAERYQQFFLIAVGEALLVIGLTYSGVTFDARRTVAFAVSIATAILIWRIYFHRAGLIVAEAAAASANPATFGRSAANTHLVMMIGIVVTATGTKVAIEHPIEHLHPLWNLPILIGPAVFIAGRARFEYEVFGRVSPSRIVAFVALLVLTVALLATPTLVASVAAATVLATVAVADAWRAWGRPPEPAAPPM